MPTPLESAQAMVAAYLQAETEILLGKEVRVGGSGTERFMRYEDLDLVRAGRKEWEARVTALQNAQSGTPAFGGLSYSLADFSNPQ